MLNTVLAATEASSPDIIVAIIFGFILGVGMCMVTTDHNVYKLMTVTTISPPAQVSFACKKGCEIEDHIVRLNNALTLGGFGKEGFDIHQLRLSLLDQGYRHVHVEPIQDPQTTIP